MTTPPRLFWCDDDDWSQLLAAMGQTATGSINAVSFRSDDNQADARDRIYVPARVWYGILDDDPEDAEDKTMYHEWLHCVLPNMHPPADSLPNIIKGVAQAIFVYRFDCRSFTSLLTFRWGPAHLLPEYHGDRAAWQEGVNVTHLSLEDINSGAWRG